METYLQLAIVLIAPTLFWAGYFYYQDRFKPEPIGKLALSYLLGMGSAFLAILMFEAVDSGNLFGDPFEMLENNRMGFALYAVGVIGPVEELAKLVPFILVCRRFREFDEKIDGIIYASMVALGFSSIENARLMEFLDGTEAYLHAIASPIVHCSLSSIWGYGYARARIAGRPTFWVTLATFVAAAILHGLYDIIAVDPRWAGSSALLILILWIAGLVLMHRLQNAERRRKESKK